MHSFRQWVQPFQFHKGTIRTQPRGSIYSRLREFQFHKGTIRTQFDQDFGEFIDNFNSIKVQLEPYRRGERRGVLRDFNSIKVQLELVGALLQAVGTPFQFHKGTIRTYVVPDDVHDWIISIP